MMQTVEDCAKAAQKRTSRKGHGHRPTSGSQQQAKEEVDLRLSEMQDKHKKKRVPQTKGNTDVKLEDRPPGKVNYSHNYSYFLQSVLHVLQYAGGAFEVMATHGTKHITSLITQLSLQKQ